MWCGDIHSVNTVSVPAPEFFQQYYETSDVSAPWYYKSELDVHIRTEEER